MPVEEKIPEGRRTARKRQRLRVMAAAVSIFIGSSAAIAAPYATCLRRYHEQQRFLANPDESVLIAAVIGWCRKHKTRLLWDEGYATVARSWSERLAESGMLPQQALPMERLRFELQKHGVTDALVRPFSVSSPAERVPPELVEFLDENASSGRFTHFAVGVGRMRGQKRMVSTLLLGRRPAIVEPIPACPQPGTQVGVSLRLLKGFSHPTWSMTTPAGKVIRDILLYQEGRWTGQVPLDAGKGTYRLEILVQGPYGPEVASVMPLYVGVEPPRAPVIKLVAAPERIRSPAEAERALLDLLNKERRNFDLPPLQADPALGKVARRHALKVLESRHVAHLSASSGSLPDRLRAAGIPFVRALENIAFAPSIAAAHQKLMDSPAHRMNILDPGITHAGIGVALEASTDQTMITVCQVLVERAPPPDLQRITRKLFELVNAHRRKRGRFALGWDEKLARTALQAARRLQALREEADAAGVARGIVERLGGTENSGSLTTRVLLTSNPRRILAAPEVLDEDINRLGAAVLPYGHPPAQYWMVVIFAGR